MFSFRRVIGVAVVAAYCGIPGAVNAQRIALCAELPAPAAFDTLTLYLDLTVRNDRDEPRIVTDPKQREGLLAIAQVLRTALLPVSAPAAPTVRSRFTEVDSGTKRVAAVIPGSVQLTLNADGTITEVRASHLTVEPVADSLFGAAIMRASGTPALVGISQGLGKKGLRLNASYALRVRRAARPVTWIRVPVADVVTPLYDGTFAVLRPGTRGPEYPMELRKAGVQGDVLVQAVLDATGQAERGSVQILRATDPGFGDVVRRWMQRTSFIPATVGGCAVRALVQMPHRFTLNR